MRRLLAGVAIGMLGSLACRDAALGPVLREDEALKGAIASAVVEPTESEAPIVIELAALTRFAWDSLYVFTPYVPADSLERRIGYRWGQARELSISHADDHTLLVFVRDGEVVAFVEQPRSRGDFATLTRKEFSRGGAIFEVVDRPGAERWPTLRPVSEKRAA